MNAPQHLSARQKLAEQALPGGTPVLAWIPGGALPGVVRTWWIDARCDLVYDVEFADGGRANLHAAAVFDARNLATRPAASYAPHGSRA